MCSSVFELTVSTDVFAVQFISATALISRTLASIAFSHFQIPMSTPVSIIISCIYVPRLFIASRVNIYKRSQNLWPELSQMMTTFDHVVLKFSSLFRVQHLLMFDLALISSPVQVDEGRKSHCKRIG